jgi:hypothetical protein
VNETVTGAENGVAAVVPTGAGLVAAWTGAASRRLEPTVTATRGGEQGLQGEPHEAFLSSKI